MSSWPDQRANSAWQAAISAANRVVLLRRHLPQPGRRGGRDPEGVDRALAGLLPAAGAVERQLQRHGLVELLGPVGELLGQQRPGQPFALPDGEVRVLRGHRGKRGCLAVGQGVVERAQFVQQHAHGPAVGDDVVRGEQQDVLVVGQADQQGPQQWTGAQVERAGVLRQQHGVQRFRARCGPVPRVRGRRVLLPQVAYRQRHGGGRVHGLHGPAVDVVERGPQGLVARHRGVQCLRQRGPVQRAGQPQGDGAVVAGVAGPELVEEPQLLLGEGERQGLRPVRARDLLPGPGGGRGLPGQAAAQRLLQLLGQGRGTVLLRMRRRHVVVPHRSLWSLLPRAASSSSRRTCSSTRSARAATVRVVSTSRG